MLTFRNLNVYDVADPDESLVEALREYPELREFEDVLTEGEEDQGTWVSWMGPLKTPTESLAKQENPAIGEIHQLGKVVNLEILEAGRREKLAKQDNPALREALSDYGSKPPASKKTKKPKASKAKPREESPKGIWGKLSFL